MKISSAGFVTLASATLLGELPLLLTFTGNLGDDIAALIAAFFLAAICALLLAFFVRKAPGWRCFGNARVKKLMKLSAVPLVAASAFMCLYTFSVYAAEIMLPGGSAVFCFIVVALIAFAAAKNSDVPGKLANLLFPLAAVFVLLIAAFSVKYIDPDYLVPHKALTFSGAFSSALPLFASLVSAALPLIIVGGKRSSKGLVLAFVFSGALLLAAETVTAGVFTSELAATQDYPFSRAVSTAAMGNIFSRMDGFLYAVCLFCCALKTAACFSALSQLLRDIFSVRNLQKN